MGRAELRRQKRELEKAKTATYNFTQEQLDAVIREKIGDAIDKMKQEATEEAANIAFALLLTIPMEVLMDHYWVKSYAKRIPEFTEHVLDYYQRWQDGELDMDAMQKDLSEYGGVELRPVHLD